MCLHVEYMFIRGANQHKKKLMRAREDWQEWSSNPKASDGDESLNPLL